jgi:hypothetical protein
MEQTNKTLLVKSEFLGSVEKFRKATMSAVMFLCPSARVEQLYSPWTGFCEDLKKNLSDIK